MIEFKKSTDTILPYNEKQYFDFLDDDLDKGSDWNGISIQMMSSIEGVESSINEYAEIFKVVIIEFDQDLPWIVNHYYKGRRWFPNAEDNLNSLRALFKSNDIPDTFKGSLLFMKDDLVKFAKDLISYPYVLSYSDLDVSHNKMPLIIKMTNHLTIDILSTDKTILKRIAGNISPKSFRVKEYRGTYL